MSNPHVKPGDWFGHRHEQGAILNAHAAPLTWHIADEDGRSSLCGLAYFGRYSYRDEHREQIAGELSECKTCIRIAKSRTKRRLAEHAPELRAALQACIDWFDAGESC